MGGCSEEEMSVVLLRGWYDTLYIAVLKDHGELAEDIWNIPHFSI